jgi:hypothetical protein
MDTLTTVIVQISSALVGGFIGWSATYSSVRRSHKDQADRDRQAHYRKLMRLLVDEREAGFGAYDSPEKVRAAKENLKEVRFLLEVIPPAPGKRQKKDIRQLRERCIEALDWIDAFDDYGLQHTSKVRPGYAHRVLVGYLETWINAAYQGDPLPSERPDIYEQLELGQRMLGEIYEETRESRDEADRLEEA